MLRCFAIFLLDLCASDQVTSRHDEQRKERNRMKSRTGYLHKRGDNWYVSWRINGKLHMKALRDDNGQAITARREAEIARDKFMAPLALADEAESLAAIAKKSNSLQALWKAKRRPCRCPKRGANTWRVPDARILARTPLRFISTSSPCSWTGWPKITRTWAPCAGSQAKLRKRTQAP